MRPTVTMTNGRICVPLSGNSGVLKPVAMLDEISPCKAFTNDSVTLASSIWMENVTLTVPSGTLAIGEITTFGEDELELDALLEEIAAVELDACSAADDASTPVEVSVAPVDDSSTAPVDDSTAASEDDDASTPVELASSTPVDDDKTTGTSDELDCCEPVDEDNKTGASDEEDNNTGSAEEEDNMIGASDEEDKKPTGADEEDIKPTGADDDDKS